MVVVGVTVAVVVAVVVVVVDVDVDVDIVVEVDAVVVAVVVEVVPRGSVPVVVLGAAAVPAVGRITDAEAEADVDVDRGGCPVVVAPVVADAEGDVVAWVEEAEDTVVDTVEGTTAEGRGEGVSGRQPRTPGTAATNTKTATAAGSHRRNV